MIAALAVLLSESPCFAQEIGNYASQAAAGRSVVITGASGERIRVTPYGDHIARVQAVQNGEDFYADDRYDMVETHDWDGALTVAEDDSSLELSTAADDGILISIAKQPLRLSFALKSQGTPLLAEQGGVTWNGNTVTESFAPTTDEHFAGLGHEAYGRIEHLDRRGTSLTVAHGDEGACLVPFYLSSRGYGVFLNTTFTHTINLGRNNAYSLSIDGEGYGGQMDYFFIAGPALTEVVDRYTQLTGRPRMPQRSLFGLLLSDKSDPDNNGEQWWKQMITDHRNAGFAFDHQVNDNAWRASNEATSAQMNSWFEFRADRFPDPAEYKQWADENGVTVTLDLNRPGIPLNPSWDNSYSIPGTDDCPDFTNPAAVDWIWQLFFTHALDPALGYPGDAIWLDEFDYPDHAHSTTLFSGKRWAEESINYHLDLLKACVQEGWDPAIGEAKRPYFWSRGITAGAQRWGAYWTGDLDGNWSDMAYQVKAMQSAGISGFPYFNHDAGAHFTPTVNEDNLYRQWDMAFGSFTPIWKPHGPGHKRWPLQRNQVCQDTAKTYITTRYQMIPYIYSYAHIAQETGMPMARPMFLEDQNNDTAWEREMQYFWGREMLVAPNASDGGNNVSVWLPSGNWYDFWDDSIHAGDTTENVSAPTGVLPVFVKEGAIFPMAPYATSTFFIPQDELIIQAYTGANGSFLLYEDDGVTERFRTQGELRTTALRFTDQDLVVEIDAAQGTYTGAPSSRSYQVIYHGLSDEPPMYVNGTAVESYESEDDIPDGTDGTVWDAENGLLNVYVASRPVDGDSWVSSSASEPEPVDTGTGGMGGAGGSGGASGAGGTAGADVTGGTAGTGGTADPTTGGVSAVGGANSAGGATAMGSGGDGSTCAAGLTLCGAECVDLQVDPGNCGQCGMVCATDLVCSVGTCSVLGEPVAPGGGNACVDSSSCPAGQVCTAGECTIPQPGGTSSAAGGDPTSASENSSGCGCTTPTSRPTLGGVLSALFGLSLLRRRQRRTRRRPAMETSTLVPLRPRENAFLTQSRPVGCARRNKSGARAPRQHTCARRDLVDHACERSEALQKMRDTNRSL